MKTLLITEPLANKNYFGINQEYWSAIIIIGISMFLAFLFNTIANRYINKVLKKNNRDTTTFVFVKHAITGLIYFVGIAMALYQIPSLKTIGQSLLAGAGILSIMVGLAAQSSLGNIVSGFMIIIFKPFKINDKVTIRKHTGIVEDINMRQVVIRDMDNNKIIIPNSIMNSEIIVNDDITHPKTRNTFSIGIGYQSNMDHAMEIIKETILKHPLILDNRTEEEKAKNIPQIIVRVVDLAESSVVLSANIWTATDKDGINMLSDIRKAIKEKFEAENIEIPYPQRTVWLNKNQVNA